MNNFLVEVQHEGDKASCDRAVAAVLSTGSHFLTNANWGCLDGIHKGWFIVEALSKAQAKMAVPVAYRNKTNVVRVVKFTLEDVEKKIKPLHRP